VYVFVGESTTKWLHGLMPHVSPTKLNYHVNGIGRLMLLKHHRLAGPLPSLPLQPPIIYVYAYC
jgi:hypothetical protein